MKKNYRNPMTRPENFMNPAGNVMNIPVSVSTQSGDKETDWQL